MQNLKNATVLQAFALYFSEFSLIFMFASHCRNSFGCQIHPSSGVYKNVTTASGTGHIICAATSLQRGQVGHVGGR